MSVTLVRMRYLAALVLISLPSLYAQPPVKATVYIYRISNYDGSFRKPSVFCDGIQIARMRNGPIFRANAKPGYT
jgi:hypothetical protein